jgi:hypothetical protein
VPIGANYFEEADCLEESSWMFLDNFETEIDGDIVTRNDILRKCLLLGISFLNDCKKCVSYVNWYNINILNGDANFMHSYLFERVE